jgi:hypothetical protein
MCSGASPLIRMNRTPACGSPLCQQGAVSASPSALRSLLRQLAIKRRQEFLGDLTRLTEVVDQLDRPAAFHEVEAALDYVERW